MYSYLDLLFCSTGKLFQKWLGASIGAGIIRRIVHEKGGLTGNQDVNQNVTGRRAEKGIPHAKDAKGAKGNRTEHQLLTEKWEDPKATISVWVDSGPAQFEHLS